MNHKILQLAIDNIPKLKSIEFNMIRFGGFDEKSKRQCKKNECDSGACFLGLFPMLYTQLGIEEFKIIDSDFSIYGFSYGYYQRRVLETNRTDYLDYLFSADWEYSKFNTLEDAIKRAKYAIKHNLSYGFDKWSYDEPFQLG